jgi:phosphatidylinositol glycan class B
MQFIPEQSVRKTFIICSLLSLGFILAASFFSYGFYDFDEHFQVLEFVSLKLHRAAVQGMAWEYAAHARQWFQPFVYYCAVKGLLALGMHDFLSIGFFLRLCSGLFGWIALVAFAGFGVSWFASLPQKLLFIRATFLLWFVPYLLVRTSSENASAVLFLLGLSVLLFNLQDPRAQATDAKRAAIVFVAGFILGMSFEMRFQVSVMVAGLVAWLVFVRRVPATVIAFLAAGIAAAIAAGAVIDRWGYGDWTFVPWAYVKAHLIQGAAARFGTSPFFAYPYLLLAHPLAPIILLLMAAFVIAWVKAPRHVLTWITLPFFAVHCLVGHKEPRFLFPIAVYAGFFLAMAFYQQRATSWLWHKKLFSVRVLLYGLNAVGFVVACFFPLNSDSQMQHYIATHFKNGYEGYTVDYDPFVLHHIPATFYRPRPYVMHYVKDCGALKDSIPAGRSPVYFTAYYSGFPYNSCGTPDSAVCLYEAVSFQRQLYRYIVSALPALKKVTKWDGRVRCLYKIESNSFFLRDNDSIGLREKQ